MGTDFGGQDYSFWKNIFLVAVFLTITPITIGISLFSLLSFKSRPNLQPKTEVLAAESPKIESGVKIFASLPSSVPSISGEISSGDARNEIVRQYLVGYASPLSPYADFIVATADKYQLDYRLTTAIAQKESNLCKLIPPGSHNCWGWGIHSEGSLGFSTYEAAIEEVSRGIREEYMDKGFTTIEKIMSKYTPASDGSWARGVNQFMAEME